MMLGARTAAWAKSGALLPYDAEVEYLESSGTQWINTLVVGNPKRTRIVIDFIPLENSVKFICGSRTVPGSSDQFVSCVLLCNGVNRLRLDSTGFFYPSSHSTHESAEMYVGRRYVIDAYDDLCIVNDVLFQSGAIKEDEDTIDMYLFCANNGGSPNTGLKIRLYGCSIFGNDGLVVRDYVPVRKYGLGFLFDRVSGMLFGNSGTGAFIIGPDKTT